MIRFMNGKHRPVNGATADRIVAGAGLSPDDTVLEIGPGKGVLTERLLKCVRRVTAVEIDRSLASSLRERFGHQGGFTLIEADVLTLDLGGVFAGVPGKIKVVSNIPYTITTPIIELLCRSRALIGRAVLMVQKEVAGRLLSPPGTRDYGLTTVNLALYAIGRRIMDVKPGAFDPPPEVMSSVIALEFSEAPRYPLEQERIFRELTGAAFRQRRKMIRNTVIPYMTGLGLSSDEAMMVLAAAGVRPEARPETIGVGSFVTMANGIGRAWGRPHHAENGS